MTRKASSKAGVTVNKPSPINLARASHAGRVQFGDVSIQCFVCDGEALLTGRGIARVLRGAKGGSLSRLLERIPSEFGDKIRGARRVILLPTGQRAQGYPADALVTICRSFHEAARTGALHHKQHAIATRATAVLVSCASVGIDALVFEATGFDSDKPESALQDKLTRVLRAELGQWERLFSREFFHELSRMLRLPLTGGRGRPMRFGAFIAKFFYEWFDEDVAEALRLKNPSPARGSNHHQWLTPEARSRFIQHQRDVILFMRSSQTFADFENRFYAAFGRCGLQQDLFAA